MTNSKEKYLVINADDFGYCPERNKGIIELYKNNKISSATLLVNGLFVNDAVELAKTYKLPLGLHFNITEGESISNSSEIETLLDKNNRFFLGKFGLRKSLEDGSVEIEHIKIELNAQIKSFIRLTGRLPTHVDGHQHIHVHQNVCQVFAQTLKENGIKWTRLPNEEIDEKTTKIEPIERLKFYQTILNDCMNAKNIFKTFDLNYPGNYLGLSTMGTMMTYESLTNGLNKAFLNSNAAELMVHPGYPSQKNIGGCTNLSGPDEFSLSNDRLHELNELSRPELTEYFTNNKIVLTNFEKLNNIH